MVLGIAKPNTGGLQSLGPFFLKNAGYPMLPGLRLTSDIVKYLH